MLDWNMNAPSHFFHTGFHYYVAGRFSFFSHCHFICGNLFHHAVEMIIKGHLAKTNPENEVRAFQHRLMDLWEKFKSVTDISGLSQFDVVVAGLDKFERARYPDRILSEGYFMRWSISKQPPIEEEAHRGMPVYEMVLEEIDKLVQAICERADVNVMAYCGIFNEDAIQILKRSNKFPLI